MKCRVNLLAYFAKYDTLTFPNQTADIVVLYEEILHCGDSPHIEILECKTFKYTMSKNDNDKLGLNLNVEAIYKQRS